MSKKGVIFDQKNILIVGGAGFIGTHLCDELIKNNKVICLDNFLTGDEDNISHLLQNPNFKLLNHNIVKELVLEKQPDLIDFRIDFQGLQQIYFLASPTSPKDYFRYPIETLLANSIGLRNCLDLAVKHKSQFFYASSPVVYGPAKDQQLIKEDYLGPVNQLGPRACYEEAKRFGETLVNNYKIKHDLDAKIARIFNCYGDKMKLDDGRIIPEIIKAALIGKDVIIYGDKNSIGSYFYVSDLIKAMTAMMDSAESGPLNIGADWKNTFTEIAQKIIKMTNSKSKIRYKEKEDYMADQLTPNISLIKEKLGWFPIVLLDEGLKKTIDYLSAQQGVLEPENQK